MQRDTHLSLVPKQPVRKNENHFFADFEVILLDLKSQKLPSEALCDNAAGGDKSLI